MHQHPPKIPLLRSTRSAKAAHVEAFSGRTRYDVVDSIRAVTPRRPPRPEAGRARSAWSPWASGGSRCHEFEVLGLGEFGHVTGADPGPGLIGAELRTH